LPGEVVEDDEARLPGVATGPRSVEQRWTMIDDVLAVADLPRPSARTSRLPTAKTGVAV